MELWYGDSVDLGDTCVRKLSDAILVYSGAPPEVSSPGTKYWVKEGCCISVTHRSLATESKNADATGSRVEMYMA